eukprot:5081934-Amphidinium_carterae.1
MKEGHRNLNADARFLGSRQCTCCTAGHHPFANGLNFNLHDTCTSALLHEASPQLVKESLEALSSQCCAWSGKG